MGGVPKVTTERSSLAALRAVRDDRRVELNAGFAFGFVTYAHAAMVDAVLATRMQCSSTPSTDVVVEVRRRSRGVIGTAPLMPTPLKLRSTAPRNGPRLRPGRVEVAGGLHFGEVPARHQRRAQRSSPALHARPYFKDAQLRRVPQYKVAVAVQTLNVMPVTPLVALAVRVAPQREAQAAS